uniref:Uncharacterized protein n=1 Tax=Timema genevievae TaxID=629358 RepID=A0A7R9K1Q3_TIMGE|nr:unnamed protein product [Timema genevievae]
MKRDLSRLKGPEMRRFLRGSENVTRRYKIIRDGLKVISLEETLKRKRSCDENGEGQKVLQNKEKGRRTIGRPRTRWMDQGQKDMEAKGVDWRCEAEGEVWKDLQERKMCQMTRRGGNVE